MDILTHGLLGGTLAQSYSRKEETRAATATGFLAALVADADALIRSDADPLLVLEYHRQFTHSLVFIPAGALLVALLLWPAFKALRRPIGFRRIYLYALLGCATSGLLDACTSYGTHLLWPFTGERIAWSIVPIFDPLFSLVLGAALLLGLRSRKTMAARAGLLLAAVYLSLGWFQHQRAEGAMRATIAQRGHEAAKLTVKPTMGNLLLWRSIYRSGGIYYVDAVRVGGTAKVYPGNTARAFDLSRDLPGLAPGSVLYRDIGRFDFFSDGYLALHPEDPGLLGDVRYAMLPTSTRPLWGIRLDMRQPEAHAPFEASRQMSREEIDRFIDMLRGKD
ncbi:metal-dependent hydrolase [Candidatus Ferrigenium straubiae]|jgi:inner membrane protein|uniref:metal-dependent hydrolase n=1 Tax=Candidatus Ferrigenium straubiae TaxID=2919506 RepID=UPI003F4A9C57